MEWDQILFKKIFGTYAKWKSRNSEEENSRTVHLEGISPRLTLLARALTGNAIDISPAEQEGGWKDEVFYLPARFHLLPTLEENLRFYLFRVVYLSIQSSEKLNWTPGDAAHTTEESRAAAEAALPAVLAKMQEDYTSVARFYQELQPHFPEGNLPVYWLSGKFMASQGNSISGAGNAPDADTPAAQNATPTTELKSKPVEEAQIIAVDKKAQDDFMLTHNFEKVETADEFSGVWRGFDGDDELADHSEALNELNLRHLVRTDEQAHSIWHAEMRDLVQIAESADTDAEGVFLTYPEWDFSKKRYKPDYCRVYLRSAIGGDLTYAQTCLAANQKSLQGLRRKFAQIHQERRMVKKLPDGEDIDMDAVVDWYAALHTGHTPSENIYFSKRKKDPDLAILFLLDLSLSTDSYAGGNRVLDVEKQAVTLFGEVLEEYGVDFAIGGFYSKTRNHCAYHSLKNFSESWSKAKQKLGAVQPQGYTRIGPALRHSKSLIETHPATQKWVILLSDGKPNDFDKYEGRYGIADVKQALREMHEHHINTYAVAIESIARYYLPEMFGQNHYSILSHPEMLVSSLTVLYRRINNA
jgi:nitric oxide reductase NorD protein